MHPIEVFEVGTERFANGLMTEANAQHLLGWGVVPYQLGHDASILGQSGAGRKHNGIECFHFAQGYLIVAPDGHIIAELLHEVHEVEGEAVVIVEDEDAQI